MERRLSARQLEAMQRRQEQEEKAQEAQQTIDDQWEQYQQMLHFWKPLPEIPSLENFIQAQIRGHLNPPSNLRRNRSGRRKRPNASTS